MSSITDGRGIYEGNWTTRGLADAAKRTKTKQAKSPVASASCPVTFTSVGLHRMEVNRLPRQARNELVSVARGGKRRQRPRKRQRNTMVTHN